MARETHVVVHIEGIAGGGINDVVRNALHIARTLTAVVAFDFNGVGMRVHPDQEFNAAVARYYEAMLRREQIAQLPPTKLGGDGDVRTADSTSSTGVRWMPSGREAL
jgi:hypothetical protein